VCPVSLIYAHDSERIPSVEEAAGFGTNGLTALTSLRYIWQMRDQEHPLILLPQFARQLYVLRLCCSVLQCVAVCCSALQMRYQGLPCILLGQFARQLYVLRLCCSVLQCAAVCCGVLQCVAVRCSVLQCVAVCCRSLQCVAVCCRSLQCIAVCCRCAVRTICITFQCCIVWQCVAVCGSVLCVWQYDITCNLT